MADSLDTLTQQIRDARVAQSFIDQANALITSTADSVTFTCENPPYAGVFSLTLPRSVWLAPLQAQIATAQATVDAVSGAASAIKVA